MDIGGQPKQPEWRKNTRGGTDSFKWSSVDNLAVGRSGHYVGWSEKLGNLWYTKTDNPLATRISREQLEAERRQIIEGQCGPEPTPLPPLPPAPDVSENSSAPTRAVATDQQPSSTRPNADAQPEASTSRSSSSSSSRRRRRRRHRRHRRRRSPSSSDSSGRRRARRRRRRRSASSSSEHSPRRSYRTHASGGSAHPVLGYNPHASGGSAHPVLGYNPQSALLQPPPVSPPGCYPEVPGSSLHQLLAHQVAPRHQPVGVTSADGRKWTACTHASVHASVQRGRGVAPGGRSIRGPRY